MRLHFYRLVGILCLGVLIGGCQDAPSSPGGVGALVSARAPNYSVESGYNIPHTFIEYATTQPLNVCYRLFSYENLQGMIFMGCGAAMIGQYVESVFVDPYGSPWEYALVTLHAAYGTPVQPTPDSLVVTCTTGLTRGDFVDCNVQRTSGLSVTITNWKFVASDGSLGLSQITENTSETYWSGYALTSGSVSAYAGISDLVIVPGTLNVAARSWGPITLTVNDLGTSDLPSLPTAMPQLGQAAMALGATVVTDQATTGPNKGLGYLSGNPITYLRGDIKINQTAMAPGSAFANRHPVNPVGNTCSRTFVESVLIQQVRKHEGKNKEQYSHTWTFEKFVNDSLPKLERMVAPVANIGSKATAFINMLQDNVTAYSDGITHNPAYNPATFTCQLVFN